MISDYDLFFVFLFFALLDIIHILHKINDKLDK